MTVPTGLVQRDIYLFIYLSNHLSIYIYIDTYILVFKLYILSKKNYSKHNVSRHMTILSSWNSLNIHLSIHLSIYYYFYLSHYYLFIYLIIYLSVNNIFYLSIYLSIYLSSFLLFLLKTRREQTNITHIKKFEQI